MDKQIKNILKNPV